MTASIAHIVDDDDAIRDSLSWLLRTKGVASRTWSAAEDFLADYRADMFGCLVLDIRMQQMSGLELFDRLLAMGCRMPAIFLTGHADVPLAVQSLKKGAFDFLEKPCDHQVLVERILSAIEADRERRSRAATSATINSRLQSLSQREHEIMKRILAGQYNKIIAAELNIAMRTVEAHRARIFEKMGVKSAVELAQLLGGSLEE